MTEKKRHIFIIIGVILAIVIAVAAAIAITHATPYLLNEYTRQVELNGERDVVLEYGEKYEELRADAQIFGTHVMKKPTGVEVTISGTVDTEKLGQYLIKYTAQQDGVVGTAYRRVQVVDTANPVITLVSDPKHYTLPTEEYEEEGYCAQDNYDGDITDRVQRVVTREKITYLVADSSGNTHKVVRKIVYDDPIAPKIKLKGKKTITLELGDSYDEPGFTATDNCDGDLTKKVSVTGNVDTDTPGTYTLQYSVKDAYDNLTAVTRQIRVKKSSGVVVPETPVVVPNGKVIYLTFDDGPGYWPPKLLNVLKKYNVKATFFVMNTDYVSTIKRIAKEGHALAIHTESHNYRKIYASESSYFKDLEKMKKIIKDLTGVKTTLIRFPGGSSNTVSSFNRGIMTRLTKKVVQKGYQYFDWNVDSNDAGGAYPSQQVYNNVINGVKNRKVSIVLQHDVKGFSVNAVEDIIVWGLKNGYTFLPLEPSSPGAHHGINN